MSLKNNPFLPSLPKSKISKQIDTNSLKLHFQIPYFVPGMVIEVGIDMVVIEVATGEAAMVEIDIGVTAVVVVTVEGMGETAMLIEVSFMTCFIKFSVFACAVYTQYALVITYKGKRKI